MMVETMLKRNNIDFIINSNIEEMKSKGITHTPALFVDNKILQGKDIFNFVRTYKGE